MPGRFAKPLSPFGKDWDAPTRARIYEQFRALEAGASGLQGTPDDPTTIVAGDVTIPEPNQSPAPSNHTHPIETAAPSVKVAFSGSASEGDASSVLRSDARLILEDGENVGDTLVWNGTEWASGDPISASVVDTATEHSTDILTELRTITYLLKVGLNVPDEIEDIRESFDDEDSTLAELRTITYFLSAGLNESTP